MTGREDRGRVAKAEPFSSRTCMRLSILVLWIISSGSSALSSSLEGCISLHMIPITRQLQGVHGTESQHGIALRGGFTVFRTGMHHLRGWSMSPLHALQAEEVERRLSGHCIFAMPNATQALEIQEGWRKQGKAAVQGTIPLQYAAAFKCPRKPGAHLSRRTLGSAQASACSQYSWQSLLPGIHT